MTYEHDSENYWASLGTHIALAGGIYPVGVILAWVPVLLFIELAFGTSDLMRLGSLIAWMLASLPITFGVGFLLTGTVATFTLLVIAGLCRLPEQPVLGAQFAIACGAMVAGIVTLPLSVAALSRFDLGLLFILHVAGAIASGQAAGAVASLRDLRRRARYLSNRGPFQISLWQIMAGMIPLAIALSLLRTLGPSWVRLSIAIGFAMALHFCTRRPVAWLVNRWADRRLRHRREQRLAARST